MEKRQVSFAVAALMLRWKIALLEWSDALYDLVTVSIHTYERAGQFVCTPLIIVERFVSNSLDRRRCHQTRPTSGRTFELTQVPGVQPLPFPGMP